MLKSNRLVCYTFHLLCYVSVRAGSFRNIFVWNGLNKVLGVVLRPLWRLPYYRWNNILVINQTDWRTDSARQRATEFIWANISTGNTSPLQGHSYNQFGLFIL